MTSYRKWTAFALCIMLCALYYEGAVKGASLNPAPSSLLTWKATSTELGHKTGKAHNQQWTAVAAEHDQGFLNFGPYITKLTPGYYQAVWSIKFEGSIQENAKILTIEAWNQDTSTRIAYRDIYASELASINTFQDLVLTFPVLKSGERLEFRSYWYDQGTITLDQVSVQQLGSFKNHNSWSVTEAPIHHETGSAGAAGWTATAAKDSAGFMIYGPYDKTIAPGAWSVLYEIGIQNPQNKPGDTTVVKLDVFNATQKLVIAEKQIKVADIIRNNDYHLLPLEFVNYYPGDMLEFRVFYNDTVDVTVRSLSAVQRSEIHQSRSWSVDDNSIGHATGKPLNGYWIGNVAEHAEQYLSYGPYASGLASGSWSAVWSLEINDKSRPSARVGRLEVFNSTSGKIITSKNIKAQDFVKANTSQDFTLPFIQAHPSHKLEFRLYWYDEVNLISKKTSVHLNSTSGEQQTWNPNGPLVDHKTGSSSASGWTAKKAVHTKEILASSPELTALSSGTWTAKYSLAVQDISATEDVIGVLEVWDPHKRAVIASRDVKRNEFILTNTNQDFYLDFDVDRIQGSSPVVLRVNWLGTSDMTVNELGLYKLQSLRYEMNWAAKDQALGHNTGQLTAADWKALKGVDKVGYMSYGPYQTGFQAGWWNASFQLAAEDLQPSLTEAIVTLDAFNSETKEVLASRVLTRRDFAADGRMKEYSLPFYTSNPTHKLEFRVDWHDKASVTSSQVSVKSISHGHRGVLADPSIRPAHRYVYDLNGRLMRIVSYDGRIKSYAYDKNGNLTKSYSYVESYS